MTDRVQGLHVAFDHDIRADDVQGIVDAVRQLRGVAAVTHIMVHADTFIARSRYKSDLFARMVTQLEEWMKE